MEKFMRIKETYIKSIAAVGAIVGIVALLVQVTMLFGAKYIEINEKKSIVLMCIGMVISCMVIPYILLNFLLINDKSRRISTKKSESIRLVIEEIVVFFIALQFNISYIYIIFYLCVGVTEEYLFRKLIFEYLNKEMSLILAIMVSNLLFALVFHINYPILENLIIRFPLSLFLTLIYKKIGYPEASIFHGIYDLFVTFAPY